MVPFSGIQPRQGSDARMQWFEFAQGAFDEEKAKITIGESNCDINIRTDLENISKYNETDLAICPENGAVLALGQDPMHLTKFQIQKDKIKIQGHSLMMGYLDNNINDEQFHDGAFFLQL